MATKKFVKSTVEERLISFSLLMTWPVYAIGGLYVLGSVLGWLLLGLILLRLLVSNEDVCNPLPVLIGVWIVGMLFMEVSLLIAHNNWALGISQTIKSSIGWAKGWALLAVFPLCGAILKFRVAIISRGCCIVASHAMLFMMLSILVFLVGGPQVLFVSPLQAVGGPGPEYFEVRFFGLNPETGLPRWFFFAPWAPAAGLISCLLLPMCLMEPNTLWRILGIVGCFMMVLMSQSRAGLAIFIVIFPLYFFLRHSFKPWILIVVGVLVPVILLLGQPVIELVLDIFQQVKESRPGSTRVRNTLASLALQRWESEAPIWGHGIVERGPKIVEHMPIGSHHSWYGLLYVKGVVGVVALAVPMLITLFYLWWQSQWSDIANTALLIILILICYSFFENLEILAYLYWPVLLYLGYALNPVNTMTQKINGS